MTRTADTGDYGPRFYATLSERVLESARAVVPLIISDLRPTSVVDFGCGEGAWLSVFRHQGVPKLRGFDGQHVQHDRLLIPKIEFSTMDLEIAEPTAERWDLAVCLEVAEHLAFEGSKRLVAALCRSSDLVLFSGAVPGQGGTHHVNEQWLEIWAGLFEEQGFRLLDIYRPRIAYDHRVAWWYRQNLVLFASQEKARALEETLRALPRGTGSQEWVHIETVRRMLSVRELLVRTLPRNVARAIRARLRLPSR